MEQVTNSNDGSLYQELHSTDTLTMSLEGAAQLLGISKSAAYSLTSDKNDDGSPVIPGLFKLGGRWLVSKKTLKKFLEGNE